MLIKKENTKYGYKGRIRYDVKNPALHVIQAGETCRITGLADLTIITGQVSISRIEGNKTHYDNLESKETYRVPEGITIKIKAILPTVILEDNITANKIEKFLDLTVKEDEPSSDDLKYIL